MAASFEGAFAKAGVTAAGSALLSACAKYFDDSRATLEEFDRIISQARARMVEGGHYPGADEAKRALPDLHQPNPEAVGQSSGEHHGPAAPSTREPFLDGGGHQNSESRIEPAPVIREPIASGKANPILPAKAIVGAPSAREPDEVFRRALARDRVQNANIWLATHKTSDGRYWSKICPYEFDGMERDGRIAGAIRRVYGPFNSKQMRTPLENLITPAMEKKIVRLLEHSNAA